ncbi:uncharacterized protein K452DRAFT_17056 [Aplosporella prunicola CBS 121167]|uniref:Uncharacterized protein n=1 Tax=Aplosporella prunicola CBS 121167 TaxID=1176127 RepID=A0A6A6BHK4_9PEZI|nr:uncharacterized protein K452DRAFT_17056 [Aplosporella prunicola CBS 121167]KAF2142317.1 hypothetical protein K452DRAFT_17056 [Aplosporella prunicola CBS 121167]
MVCRGALGAAMFLTSVTVCTGYIYMFVCQGHARGRELHTRVQLGNPCRGYVHPPHPFCYEGRFVHAGQGGTPPNGQAGERSEERPNGRSQCPLILYCHKLGLIQQIAGALPGRS